ncbi:hypothetical protein M9194_02245 [Vibrio sp. S4M6]|uniref:outer membrane protein OmpK n=1 Tax=Vibrio sinus TaxID=2946865 RepID=UPI00202A50EC|nr:outer membrane protein OmpK [Vibrio sinus]MCL9780251.1 hypothetical protein [Vibrio sinus]
MKRFTPLIFLFSSFAIFETQAEYLSGFGSVAANYYVPSPGTKDRSPYVDNTSVALYGGSRFDWGELYGTASLHYLNKSSEQWRTRLKGSVAYKTGFKELRLYAQSHSVDGPGFSVDERAMGLSYRFEGQGWFVAPWVGALYSNTQRQSIGYNGFNGGIVGIRGAYTFKIMEEKFRIVGWNETEFSRDASYLAVMSETSRASLNGALAILWQANDTVSMGIRYRFMYNNLFLPVNTNAVIYSVQFNLP